MTLATLAAITIAAATWHHPCNGNVNVQWGPMLNPLDAAEAIYDTSGRAPFTNCQVRIEPHIGRVLRDHDWPLYCTLIVHEYGHLAGEEHSTNPRSVMYPYLERVFPPCNTTPRTVQ